LRRTVRAAGIHAPRKTVFFGVVSGVVSRVVSRAGSVPTGATRTIMCTLAQAIQASALLTCVGEQCLNAAHTNAVQFLRHPGIAIPKRRSPEFASSFSDDRAGPHGTHRKT
jgi:hypothetical protein